MAMSDWMQSVTGRSNSEHQAWRDNYNGGWAAGDWTGNTNDRIAWERAASGEDNSEIRARLPEGLTPEMISGKSTSNANRGGSVGQGASPSQSGGRSPVIGEDPQVKRASGTSVIGAGKFTAARMNFGQGMVADTNFGQSVADALMRFSRPGSNKQEWDDKPAGHGQLYVNGHLVVHDRGWSTAEVAEDIYGDDFSPATLYGWGKAFADMEATLAANGMTTVKQAYESTDKFTGPWEQAGRDIRGWAESTYGKADKAWNEMVQGVNKAIPPSYTSEPMPANPYSGGSAWSMPFQ